MQAYLIVSGRELNPWFNILTVVRDSRFRFNIEDLKGLLGLNSMIYADDEEAGGERIGDEGGLCHLFSLFVWIDGPLYGRWNQDGDANVGGAHRKYGLEDGGIVVCRPDGYGE